MRFRFRGARAAAASWFLLFPTLIFAQDSSHTFTAMDEFQLQVATDPQICCIRAYATFTRLGLARFVSYL